MPWYRFIFAILALVAAAWLSPASDPPTRNSDNRAPPARGDRYGDPLPPGALTRLGTTRFRHGAWIAAVSYTPDGRAIGAGDRDGFIRLWEASTGKQLWGVHPYRTVDCLAFATSGKVLASAGPTADGSALILWDVSTGLEKHRPVQAKERIRAIAFSSDGKFLAVAIPNEHVIRVLDGTSGKELHRVKAFCSEPRSLAFSPDSTLLAGPGIDQTVRLWDAATGKELRQVGEQHRGDLVRFSPDGNSLAVGGSQKVVTFAVSTGKKQSELRVGSVGPAAFTPDGKGLLVGEVGTLHFWDVAKGKEVWRIDRFPGSIISLSLGPDGKTVVVGTTDGALRLVDVATQKESFPHDLGSSVIRSAALAPDGKTVATTLNTVDAATWDVETGKPRWLEVGADVEYSRRIFVLEARFSPDGKTVAFGCSAGAIILRDADSGRVVRRWKAQDDGCLSLAFSPDGRSLACKAWSDGIPISDVATGTVRLRLSDPDRRVSGVLFTPDARFIATANDGQLRVCDSTSGEVWRSFTAHQDIVVGFAVSPDGRTLASSGREGPVRIWELLSGKERGRLEVASSVTALAYAPGSRTLAAGSSKGSIRLYDLADGKEWHRLDGHLGAIDSLEFSADGRVLLSKSQDTTALIWDVAALNRKMAAPPPTPLSAEQVDVFWADLASADAVKANRAIVALSQLKEVSPLLRERVLAVSRTYPQRQDRIKQRIAALNDDQFKERERATTDLRNVRDDAESWLRQALADNVSLEVNLRIRQLLEEMRGACPDAETLRVVRTVEILEHLGTPEARDCLKKLAEGHPAFPLTQAAQAAVKRRP